MSGVHHLLTTALLAALVCGVNACGEEGAAFVAPDSPGPHHAGYLGVDIVGRSGATLQTLVWYPTAAGPELETDYSGLDITEGSALYRAAGACDQPRPVVLFSHGHRGVRYQNYRLCEHLARHGYVVIAPDHFRDTVAMLDEDDIPSVFLHRPHDVMDAYAWLVDEAADPSSELAGCVDPEAGFATIGHSFGGWTSLALAGAALDIPALEATCLGDARRGCNDFRTWQAANPGVDRVDFGDVRSWGAVAITPAFVPMFGENLAQIEIPVLLLGGDRDTLAPWATDTRPAYDGLTTRPRYLVRFEDVGHNTFTDFCQILLIAGLEYNGCSDDFRPVPELAAQFIPLVLAFLETLRGRAQNAAWLGSGAGIDVWEAVP